MSLFSFSPLLQSLFYIVTVTHFFPLRNTNQIHFIFLIFFFAFIVIVHSFYHHFIIASFPSSFSSPSSFASSSSSSSSCSSSFTSSFTSSVASSVSFHLEAGEKRKRRRRLTLSRVCDLSLPHFTCLTLHRSSSSSYSSSYSYFSPVMQKDHNLFREHFVCLRKPFALCILS